MPRLKTRLFLGPTSKIISPLQDMAQVQPLLSVCRRSAHNKKKVVEEIQQDATVCR